MTDRKTKSYDATISVVWSGTEVNADARLRGYTDGPVVGEGYAKVRPKSDAFSDGSIEVAISKALAELSNQMAHRAAVIMETRGAEAG